MPDARCESRFIRTEDPRFPSCHAPTIVETLDGDLLAAWSAGTSPSSGLTSILTSRLRSGGWHWTPFSVFQEAKRDSHTGAVLFTDPYGTVWLFWVTRPGGDAEAGMVRARRSAILGYSWDDILTIEDAPGWMTRHKPATLRTEEVMLPLHDERDARSFVLVSTDSAHWEARGEIRSEFGVTQPALAQLSDGSVVAFLRRGARDPERRLWRSVSRDAGRSWSRPERTAIPNPNSGADVVHLSSGALLLAFNNSQVDRTPLSLGLSLDDGRTWRYVRNLESEPGQYAAPAVIQASDGTIHVVYSWNREAIKHVALNEDWIREGGKPLGR
jgi:predicted neuraminidase